MHKNIDGIEVEYQKSSGKAADGAEIILLHGWGANKETMMPVFKHLAERYTVYNIDLPGFGASSEPASVWGTVDYADFVQKFCAACDISQPVLVGHSFGGKISIILGARGFARKVILADSAGILPKRGLDYYIRVYSYKAAKRIMNISFLLKYKDKVLAIWQKNNPSSDYTQAQGIMRRIFVKVVNESVVNYLPKINVPALLIWGGQDTATPLADGQLMEKLIPDSGLVVFEGAGHYSFLEQPGRFNKIVDYFLQTQ
jgi:pimeloyl-ACP methyl ester carboxylesterase